MKILFVSSKNTFRYAVGEITPQVLGPGRALERAGVSIKYFLIQSKGFKGYMRSILLLRNYLRKR
ncbi:MAG: hypothetical protein WCL00_15670, partial [Bacteroidota bacterium]